MLGGLFADTRALAISSPIRVRIDRAAAPPADEEGSADPTIVASTEPGRSSAEVATMPAEPIAWREAHCCHVCRREFSLTRRVHHCRECGGAACARCSRHLLSVAGHDGLVRACVLCWEERRQRLSEANDGLFGARARNQNGLPPPVPSNERDMQQSRNTLGDITLHSDHAAALPRRRALLTRRGLQTSERAKSERDLADGWAFDASAQKKPLSPTRSAHRLVERQDSGTRSGSFAATASERKMFVAELPKDVRSAFDAKAES